MQTYFFSNFSRWKSECTELESYIYNLKFMHEITEFPSVTLNDVPKEIRDILNSPEDTAKVTCEINKYKPVCDFIDYAQRDNATLSEACEMWIDLKLPANLIKYRDNRNKMILDQVGLISNVLDHRFKGKKLIQSQKAIVDNQMMKELTGTTEYLKFHEYLEGSGIFSQQKFNELESHEYWQSFNFYVPKLSQLALLYTSLPASTAELERLFSMWGFVHDKVRNRLTSDKSDKLIFLYHKYKTQQ